MNDDSPGSYVVGDGKGRLARMVAVVSALIMLLLVFQGLQVGATKPNTGSGEYNHALASNGGVATASGYNAPNVPGNAIDNLTSTYWQSSTTTGWLAVAFAGRAYINEVHIHFVTTKYPSLSLYYDSNANGAYETTEKVWSNTSNGQLDVVVNTATTYTLGIKVTVDAKVGSNSPRIAEFEAYLRYDSDGDGLTNDVETSTLYYQDMAPGGFPQIVPNAGLDSVLFYNMGTIDGSGNMLDLSAAGNNGLLTATTASSWNEGIARHFAPGASIRTNPSPSLDLATQMTLALWFNPDDVTTNQTLLVLSGDTTHKALLGIRNGNLYPQLRTHLGLGLGGTYSAEISGGPMVPGFWHYYVVTYKAADRFFRVYLDNMQAGSVATDGLGLVSDSNVTASVGSWPSKGLGFSGFIDEVQVWNRVLTPGEIQSYFMRRPPVLYYDMEHAKPGYMLDMAGDGYDGALTGTTSISDGKIGTARQFNGVSDVVVAADDVIRSRTGITLTAWFRTTSHGVIWSYQNTAPPTPATNYVPALYVGQDGLLRGQFWTTDHTVSPVTSIVAVNDGLWHHAAMGTDGVSQTLFLDGVAVGIRTGNRDSLDMIKNLVGGGRTQGWPGGLTGSWDYFKGALDEVYIYDHLLRAAEVKASYSQGRGPVSTSTSLAQFSGVPHRSLVTFTLDAPTRTDFTATIGYWDGSAWIDRYVWDPANRLPGIRITQPIMDNYYSGVVSIVAYVEHPEVTQRVEFYDGWLLLGADTVPDGGEYRWDWDTRFGPDGPRDLRVIQYVTDGTTALDNVQVFINNQPPDVTWLNPLDGSTVKGTLPLQVSATDMFGIARADFYVDNFLKGSDTIPDPGTSTYQLSWDSTQVPNGFHTLRAVAVENTPQQLSTGWTITVNVNNPLTVSITYPLSNQQISGIVTVTANAATGSGTVTKVEFYVNSVIRATDTTGPSPYTWDWDTASYPDGSKTLMAKAYDSVGNTATHSITVKTLNGVCGTPPCPTSPTAGSAGTSSSPSETTSLNPLSGLLASAASPASTTSSPKQTLGILGSDWALGETDSGSKVTLVIDLVVPQAGASATENASGIMRPAFPISYFTTYLQWRLLVRQWSIDGAGELTDFTLRYEAKSDPNKKDTDGDGLSDYTEKNTYGILPVTRDSDLDGLSDGYEVAPHTLTLWKEAAMSILPAFTTDPAKSDTDGDGLGDGQERGVVTTGQSKSVGETGNVTTVTEAWTRVYLRNRYTNPVVIAQPPSWHDGATGVIRLRSVTDHSFELRFQEWSEVGTHSSENVSYIVMEAGNHVLTDGTVVELGTASVGTTYGHVNLREVFPQAPCSWPRPRPSTTPRPRPPESRASRPPDSTPTCGPTPSGPTSPKRWDTWPSFPRPISPPSRPGRAKSSPLPQPADLSPFPRPSGPHLSS